MGDITIKESQKIVDDWIKNIGVKYFSEMTQLAQLTEEVGEVARIISRTYGTRNLKKKRVVIWQVSWPMCFLY